MDRDTIIDGLRMTMDLFTFDPTTGEEKDPDDLNDLDRATYDACKGALEILERLDTDSDTISRQAAIDDVHVRCNCDKDGHYIGYVANFTCVCDEWEVTP